MPTLHMLVSTPSGDRVPLAGTPKVLNTLFMDRLSTMNAAQRGLVALGLRVADTHLDLTREHGHSVIVIEPGQDVSQLLEVSKGLAFFVRKGRRFTHVLYCGIDVMWEQTDA